jgi:hypothetical protein
MMQGTAIRSEQAAAMHLLLLIKSTVAFLLGLHMEQTHTLPDNPVSADYTRAEEARRLFWTLYLNE